MLCEVLRLKPTEFPYFYPKLKSKLNTWKAQALWTKFDKRAAHKCYGRGKVCAGQRVLVIGCGPCGLRTAIEAQFLGAKVVVVEKRDRYVYCICDQLGVFHTLYFKAFAFTDSVGIMFFTCGLTTFTTSEVWEPKSFMANFAPVQSIIFPSVSCSAFCSKWHSCLGLR